MTQEIHLGVNIDHGATLRQARYREYARDRGQMVEPDPLALALLAERAGADGITVHLREDRRHIQESDVRRLRECLQTRLNLEMACTPEMVEFAIETQPDSVCLVPENREEVTTEGGLDVVGNERAVRQTTAALRDEGIAVSLFLDPDPQAIALAAECGATMVELHTGSYANHYYLPKAREEELSRLREAAVRVREAGMLVNAGHGINYVNIQGIRTIPWLHELNIGHAILSRALFTGIEEAVREMKSRIRGA